MAGAGTEVGTHTAGLRSHRFHVLRFDQPWIKNIRKKNSTKFHKAKLEFAARQPTIYTVSGIMSHPEMV